MSDFKKTNAHEYYTDLYQRPLEYDRIHNEDIADIPFFVDEATLSKGPVLELGCGTGRVTIPVAESGVETFGLDISPQMLNRAREKAKLKNVNLELIEGDFRNFKLKKQFSLIFIAFNSLHHFSDFESIQGFLKSAKIHLKPNGKLIVADWNPGFKDFPLQEDPRPSDDDILKIDRIKWFKGNPNERYFYFYKEEYRTLLAKTGFQLVEVFGDCDRSEYRAQSLRMIVSAKPAK